MKTVIFRAEKGSKFAAIGNKSGGFSMFLMTAYFCAKILIVTVKIADLCITIVKF